MKNDTLPTIDEFKRRARKFKREHRISTFGEALNALAVKYGYKNWFTIKPALRTNAEPLVLTYIYIVTYTKDTIVSSAPYTDVYGSREEMEGDILWIIREEYGAICPKFGSFEEAWAFYLKMVFEGRDKSWIKTEKKEISVRPHGRPNPIYSMYGDVFQEKNGKNVYSVSLEDDLRSQYYEEYYDTMEEAEARDREIEAMETSEWDDVLKSNVNSNYEYRYGKSPVTVLTALVTAKALPKIM